MNPSFVDSILYLWSKILKKSRGRSVKNSRIHFSSKIESGSLVVNSTMGRNSFCGYDCAVLNSDIGAFCSLASRVFIGGAGHPMHFVSTSPVFLSHRDSVKEKYASHDFLPETRTKIGNDVWIGDGAFVKAGVEIGDGAVIGMGAVVTKDVAPYAIVAGNPARLIRYRFDEKVIRGLLDSRWWEWPDERLRALGAYMNNPSEFLSRIDIQ